MYTEFALIHGAVCTALFLLCFLLLRSRGLWYLASGLYLLNMLLVTAYLMVSAMTGKGFNEAALYYLLNASWKDVVVLTAYDAFAYGVPVFLVFLLLFVYSVRKVKLTRWLSLSMLSQTLVVVGTGFFGLYMTPLAADLEYALRASGLDKKDHIGLQDVMSRNDVPQSVPGPKKNLIMLYAESLEAGLFDEKLFPDLLPQLNRIAAQGVRFDHINQAPMSDWTIAGMIATQCGVPLSSHRIRNESNNFGKFSTVYQCLSNYVAQQGYTRVYMGGASGSFAGKGDYYRSMEFDEVLGLEQLSKPESPQSKWGIYDDELLPLVQGKLMALRANEGKPFALLALTLDSHPPSGYASPSCARRGLNYGKGSPAHLDAIRCTDVLLAEFLERVIRENIHDSTIVLLSDHIMMSSEATDALTARKAVRRNHMVIWDKSLAPQVVHRAANQFDVAPTVLQVLLEQSYQVGFGTSMLDARPNLTERFGQVVFDESVQAWRTESWKKW